MCNAGVAPSLMRMNYELHLIQMQGQYPSDLLRLQSGAEQEVVASPARPDAFRPAEMFTIDLCKSGKGAVRGLVSQRQGATQVKGR